MKCRYKKSAYVPGQSVLATTCCTRRNVISLSQKKWKYLHHHSHQQIVTHAPTCLAAQFDLQTCLLDIFNDMFGAQFSDTWSLVKTPSPFKVFFHALSVFPLIVFTLAHSNGTECSTSLAFPRMYCSCSGRWPFF